MNVIIWSSWSKHYHHHYDITLIIHQCHLRHYHSFHHHCCHHYLVHRNVTLSVKLMIVANSNYPSYMRVYQSESTYHIISLIVAGIHIWSLANNCISTSVCYTLLIIHRISNKSRIKKIMLSHSMPSDTQSRMVNIFAGWALHLLKFKLN